MKKNTIEIALDAGFSGTRLQLMVRFMTFRSPFRILQEKKIVMNCEEKTMILFFVQKMDIPI